jgi:DNA-binding response OmpR family regulator
MESTSVLIVDDEPGILEAVSSFLDALEGFTSVPVPSASVALSRLEEQSFDLVLSDVRMEGMDGYTFLSVLRKEYPNLPVILITGGPYDYEEGIALGANDFLRKPFDFMAMKARILLVLQNARLINELELNNQKLEESNGKLREEQEHLMRLVDSWLTNGVDDSETRKLLTEILKTRT